MARESLESTQSQLANFPQNMGLIEKEITKAYEYKRLSWIKEAFIKQKSRVQWLKEGISLIK